MKAANVLGILLALAATAGTALWVGRATATGAPQQAPLTYAGTLTDQDGKPYPTAQEVVVKFWDAASGGTQKCAATPVQAEAGTGNFQVTLPAECVQAVRDQSELWTELTVGPQKVVLPRSKVAAVPYALEADSAKVAGSAAAASGGLKTQVEGLVSDVAGLKGKSGGAGPQVKDATGAVLGTIAPGTYTSWLSIQTSTGHVLRIMAQNGLSGEELQFSQWGCTGPGAIQVAGNVNGYLPLLSGVVFYVKPTGGVPSYLMISGPVGAPCVAVGFGFQSKWQLDSNGSYSSYCKSNATESTQLACPLVQVTGAQVGLPDKIVGPLTYVP